jgi:hypothetical protein
MGRFGIGGNAYADFFCTARTLVIPAEAGISLQIAPRRLLQNEVKVSRFSSRYLMTVDMSDFDRAVARHEKAEEIAKKMRDANKPIEEIIQFTGLSEKTIREL